MKRGGRRLSPVSLQVLGMIRDRALGAEPLTLRGLTHAAQMSYADADDVVRRLVSGGHVRYGEPLPSSGGRPPRALLPAEPAAAQRGAELHCCMGMMIRTVRR